jgi:transcriptional regulator with XRE-family HTH domain
MNKIRELRESRRWTQGRLGKELNCTAMTISRYESEKHEIGSDMICKLCDIFDCTADYLLGRSATGGLQLTPEEENLILALRRADTRAVDMVNVALAPFKQDESSAKADITA